MLVPASDSWRGTDGSCYASVAAFATALQEVTFVGGWKPSNICLHNTAGPSQAQWDATVPGDDALADARQRLLNLTSYYQGLGWQGQPHLYITNHLIVVGNPLNRRGTHSTCFNGTHWGIEMVGDYNLAPPEPGTKALAIGAMAAMCAIMGFDPARLNFHKDCVADQHDCPGHLLTKGEVIALVRSAMAGGDTNSHLPPTGVVPVPLPVVPVETAVAHLQASLNELGIKNSSGKPIAVDGWPGKETQAAMEAAEALLWPAA